MSETQIITQTIKPHYEDCIEDVWQNSDNDLFYDKLSARDHNTFANDSNINMVNENLLNIHQSHHNQFDLGLLLWATHSTFNRNEQLILFKNLSETLCQDGILIVDTCSGNNKRSFKISQQYTAAFNDYDHFGEMTQAEALFEDLSRLKMSFVEVINYEKTHYGYRQLIIFQKS